MGFRPTVRIVKRRRVGRVGSLSVCVDEVSGLGTFLEVEMITDRVVDATRELDAFVRSLGIASQPVTQTYDSLLRAAGIGSV
jgi:adenylate cyclase class 2